jgi:hypothetical protein
VFPAEVDGSKPWRPDLWTRRFAKLRDQAGTKARLHDVRHFVATTPLTSGVDLATVAGRLGHGGGGKSTLAIYSYFLQEPDRIAADVMGTVLKRKPIATERGTGSVNRAVGSVMRRTLVAAVLSLVSAGTIAVGSSPVSADCSGPTIRYTPGTVSRGDIVTVQGFGWGDNCYDTGPPPSGQGVFGVPVKDIAISFVQGNKLVRVARGAAEGDYRFEVDVRVPRQLKPGSATIGASWSGGDACVLPIRRLSSRLIDRRSCNGEPMSCGLVREARPPRRPVRSSCILVSAGLTSLCA